MVRALCLTHLSCPLLTNWSIIHWEGNQDTIIVMNLFLTANMTLVKGHIKWIRCKLWRNSYHLFYLCSVVEVSKLSFPTDKCKWICHAKSQLKTCKNECALWISIATGKISLNKLHLHKKIIRAGVGSSGVAWIKISDPFSFWIMVHQRNRWVHSGHGFIGALDAPWSEWPQITDLDPQQEHNLMGN